MRLKYERRMEMTDDQLGGCQMLNTQECIVFLPPIHILSLGAGIQSSTMALMAAAGEITPMPKCAIFADTQAEPKSVYTWLDWLENQLPFPVHRVTFGSLLEKSLIVHKSKSGSFYTKHSPPAYITDGQSDGMLMRQCTANSKIAIIIREIRKIRGSGKKRSKSYSVDRNFMR